jgi:glucose-fructose oxidoreductase
MSERNDPSQPADKVRYAVVGLGWFAQAAVLPAFEHAAENSGLAALVSGDEEKLAELGERYGVPAHRRVGYDRYEDLLGSGEVDAVYVATPNHLHHEFTVRAARAGAHVLCEKPMAVTAEEGEEMVRTCAENRVRLMVAYRLHFEPANLRAAEIVSSGRLGRPCFFSSVFASQVTNEDDIRLDPIELGGGSLYDIGVYCINATRYLFRAEPTEVMAVSVRGTTPRRAECDETTTAVLRFPEDRLATFTCSFAAADRDAYRVLGTEGELLVEPAFEFRATLRHRLTVGGETVEESFAERDQIAPEILHFSRCVLEGRDPEPDGNEGLADVAIIRALHRSAAEGGRPVRLGELPPQRRPTAAQEEDIPAPERQELVNAEAPSD